MDVRAFVKKLVADGEKQMDIANRTGVSQGTIYKLLHTETRPTMDVIMKIAKGYGRPYTDFVAEDGPTWNNFNTLNEKERRMLAAFRNMDERRQDRALDTLDDMVLALRESYSREGPAKDCGESNSERK